MPTAGSGAVLAKCEQQNPGGSVKDRIALSMIETAEAAGLKESQVVLYPMPAGGSFDRRLEHDHAIEAVAIAKAVGKPVQLTWSRWQEHLAGWPRPPVSAVMAAKVAPGGTLTGWKARLAMPASGHEFGQRLFGAPQFLDLAFQFGDRLLEIEEVRVHSRFALRPSPAATRQCSPRGAVVKSACAGRFRYGGGFGCMRRLSRAERAPTKPAL